MLRINSAISARNNLSLSAVRGISAGKPTFLVGKRPLGCLLNFFSIWCKCGVHRRCGWSGPAGTSTTNRPVFHDAGPVRFQVQGKALCPEFSFKLCCDRLSDLRPCGAELAFATCQPCRIPKRDPAPISITGDEEAGGVKTTLHPVTPKVVRSGRAAVPLRR